MTTTTTAARAVRRGAAVLDVVRPGWADQIDLARLDLSDSRYCILGQLWGDAEYGVAHVLRRAPCRLRPPASVAARWSWPAWYGFEGHAGVQARARAAEARREAWAAEIAARRGG